ncbi:hypothetical protein X975_15560, partial [Stegodyphus mimosarum]
MSEVVGLFPLSRGQRLTCWGPDLPCPDSRTKIKHLSILSTTTESQIFLFVEIVRKSSQESTS